MPETTVYDFTLKGIDGGDVPLSTFKGKVLLVVNVASKCGFTPQYKGLEALYERYRDRGFVILGFPSNDFLRQEPGTDAEIMQFCSLTYGVSFPMFAKSPVRGKAKNALYRFLTDKALHPETGGEITWNFNKFLVGRDGRVVARFDSKVAPEDAELTAAIEQALGR